MQAVLWSDYLCPWCWIGRDRTAQLEELGVTVTALPYELHPEIPPDGRRLRPDGRLKPVFDRVEALCAEVGMPFARPPRMPNTRRALATAEVVRRRWPGAFPTLHESLFDAHWLEGSPLDDPAVLDELTGASGAPVDEVRALVDDGTGGAWVDESMARAHEHGVTATPAWLVDDALLIPGAQPRETVQRWVTRLQERRQHPSVGSERG